MDEEILKDKIQTVSNLMNIAKGVGVVLLILNIVGLFYNKIEFTILLSLIMIIAFWLWALDTQVGRIEKLLNEKGVLGGRKMVKGKKSKKGLTQVGKVIVWILIGLAAVYVLSLLLKLF